MTRLSGAGVALPGELDVIVRGDDRGCDERQGEYDYPKGWLGLAWPDYGDGAPGVMNAVIADRPEQRADESPVPVAAHDQQVGVCRCIDEDLGRVALDDAGAEPARMISAEYLLDSMGESLFRELGQALFARVGRRQAGSPRIMPDSDDLQCGAGELRLPGRPPERVFRAVRPVDPHDDNVSPFVRCCHLGSLTS
jgi:hypothetical protein